MKEVAGSLLHPAIPVNRDNLRIADVGTGTGAWALDAAVKFPAAQVDGFDITDTYFAPTYNIPNVSLVVHDCYQPFPAEYRGKYDIVQARFWLCHVNNPDAAILLENILTLLKPGGHIQWYEPLSSDATIVKPESVSETPIMERHIRLFQNPREDTTHDWVSQLPSLFQSCGLQNVVEAKRRMGDNVRAMWIYSNVLGVENTADDVRRGIGEVEEVKAYSRMLQEEIKKGIAIDVPFTWVAGQKHG